MYDLGGGTFDVSVMRVNAGNFTVKSTGGNTHLGGEDFDNILLDHFLDEYKRKTKTDMRKNKKQVRRLRVACERAKRRLSAYTEAFVEVENFDDGKDFSSKITRAKFESLCLSLFKETIVQLEETLKESHLEKSDIDEIIMVGGSSRIPKIKEWSIHICFVKKTSAPVFSAHIANCEKNIRLL